MTNVKVEPMYMASEPGIHTTAAATIRIKLIIHAISVLVLPSSRSSVYTRATRALRRAGRAVAAGLFCNAAAADKNASARRR